MESGKTTDGLHSLLHAMQKIYSGIMSSLVRERITSYHEGNGSRLDDDIGTSLNHYIDSVTSTTATAQTQDMSEMTDPPLPGRAELSQKTGQSANQATLDIQTPLTDHFKKNKSYSELSPHIGEKLQNSAWEHTHTAIRLAHRGDIATAKLHANLANNAIKELGHYLSEADYTEFKNAIKAELLNKV